MQKVKIFLGVLMLAGICGCGLADAISDALTAGYNFDTSCASSESDSCDTCCTDIEFDTYVYSSEDGCGCAKYDKEICGGSADGDACRACCDGLGDNYSGSSLYVSSGGEATCGVASGLLRLRKPDAAGAAESTISTNPRRGAAFAIDGDPALSIASTCTT